jgi:hypothetical protein
MKTLLQMEMYYVRECTSTCRFLKIINSTLTLIISKNLQLKYIRAFDSRLYLDISKSSSSDEKNRLCIINVRRKAYKLKLNKMCNNASYKKLC